MAVPAPSIAPSLIAGGANHLIYQGNVGVGGAPTTLNVDLTELPEIARSSTYFIDQLLITIRDLSGGNISSVVGAVSGSVQPTEDDFGFLDGIPEYLMLEVTSTISTNQMLMMLEARHSIGR